MKSKNLFFFKCRMLVYQLHRCNKIRVETAAHPCRASVSDGWCERSHVKSWVRGISMKHVSHFHSVHWFYSVITRNSIWQANSWKWHIMSAVRTSILSWWHISVPKLYFWKHVKRLVHVHDLMTQSNVDIHYFNSLGPNDYGVQLLPTQ
jgi:hypothetical protein